MCGCGIDSPCWGGCPCGCTHTGDPSARYYRDRRGFVGVPNPENHDSSARPVVVIDPEDRGQVERLIRTWLAADDDKPTPHGIDTLQATLRRFANPTPPKPDEPTGLGAVVKDADEEWVHFGNGCFIKTVPNANLRQKLWSDFSPAVRVLSVGVTP